jgi:hypothetical protein
MGQAMMMRFGGLVLAAALVATPASAQFWVKKAPASSGSVPTRDQVRMRILDQCVMSQSGKSADQGAGPKCGCYATKMSKAMTDQEVAAYRKALPKRLSAEAQPAFASCK